jgi:predicted RNA-binding protein YlxR (DUF448 family)
MTRHEPERRCILSGETLGRDGAIRLALSPGGEVLPDVGARAPGRGAWVRPDRTMIAEAEAKGKLKGALARAFRGEVRRLPEDLAGQIETALRKRVLSLLGLELAAGRLVLGTDRIAGEGVCLLLHAADAAPDGVRKLEQRLQSRREIAKSLVLPVGRDELSLALGQNNVVHAALRDRRAALRVEAEVERWRDYLGLREKTNADAEYAVSDVTRTIKGYA